MRSANELKKHQQDLLFFFRSQFQGVERYSTS